MNSAAGMGTLLKQVKCRNANVINHVSPRQRPQAGNSFLTHLHNSSEKHFSGPRCEDYSHDHDVVGSSRQTLQVVQLLDHAGLASDYFYIDTRHVPV